MSVRSAPTASVSHQVVELAPGKHASPAQGVCVVELASMLADEPFGDHPRCVCPVVASYMRTLNDGLGDARRGELIPYAAAIVGTRGPRALRARLCLGWAGQLGVPPSRLTRLLAGWAAAERVGRLCARAALRGAGPAVALTLADALIAEGVEPNGGRCPRTDGVRAGRARAGNCRLRAIQGGNDMDACGNGHAELREMREHTRVMLQPIAAPSILGLFGFAGATFIVAAHLAGWYGTAESPAFLFPFAAMFGGLAQFLAGMWAFKARDGVATAMHGMWGSFWLAYGILNLLVAVGVYEVPTGSFPELGFWFLVLAAITGLGTIAALAENVGLFATLGALAVGAAFLAVHYLTGVHWWEVAGGWILIGSAVAATYTAGAMMLEGAWGRVVLPLGKAEREANVPGARVTLPIEYEHAEPGVRMGQ